MLAFESFYETEFPRVFRATFLLIGDRQAAEEATQEAFARCLERWRRLGGESWVGGWVTTTSLNVARRQLKRSGPAQVSTLEDVGYEGSEPDIDLWRAVRALPERQQEAVVLHHVVDISIQDCARLMKCDPGTVKTHLHRARQQLARSLGGERV